MCKLAVYRAEHGSYKEAFNSGAVYSTSHDELEPEFVDSGRTQYLSDVSSIINTVLEASGRDDLIVGSVIHGIFWTLDDLYTHFEKINEWPDVDYPVKVIELASVESNNDEISNDQCRYDDAINLLTGELPGAVKAQVIALAIEHGYGCKVKDIVTTG